MAKTSFRSVDEYLASQPAAVQHILLRVRDSICEAVPEAQEVISYNMPTYKINGDRFIYFAVWRNYYSIYGATQQLAAAFREELKSYKVEKGTIRLPLSEPVPVALIKRIAQFRAREVTVKAAAPNKEPV